MKLLGELIKELRESNGLTQRKLAYELDIDVSVLSKIENENRFPKKRVPEIIIIISNVFSIPEDELHLVHLSDEVAAILANDKNYKEVLKVAEDKVKYIRQKNTIQSEIEFDHGGN